MTSNERSLKDPVAKWIPNQSFRWLTANGNSHSRRLVIGMTLNNPPPPKKNPSCHGGTGPINPLKTTSNERSLKDPVTKCSKGPVGYHKRTVTTGGGWTLLCLNNLGPRIPPILPDPTRSCLTDILIVFYLIWFDFFVCVWWLQVPAEIQEDQSEGVEVLVPSDPQRPLLSPLAHAIYHPSRLESRTTSSTSSSSSSPAYSSFLKQFRPYAFELFQSFLGCSCSLNSSAVEWNRFESSPS